MIYVKTEEEIEKMRAACDLTSRTLGKWPDGYAPGRTTRRLDTP